MYAKIPKIKSSKLFLLIIIIIIILIILLLWKKPELLTSLKKIFTR